MIPGIPPRIKICCIADEQEAQLAVSYGAAALGLVARMPSGPGPIPDESIRRIAGTVPPPIFTFLLTCETTAEAIIAHHRRTFTTAIQLVDRIDESSYALLREALPGVRLIQVIHVLDEYSVEEAIRLSGKADALLLDSGNPNLAVKELGGTGRVHDWRLSRMIREQAQCPVFLAGGLKPENVRRAIDEVEPFGIDVCSGVRTEGRLDPSKLELFFREAGHKL